MQFPFAPGARIDHPIAYPGMIGNSDMGRHIMSRETDAIVSPGRFVCQRTAATATRRRVRNLAATGDVALIEGVVVAANLRDPDPYAVGKTINVMRRGPIWVEAFDLVSEATPATFFIIHGNVAGNAGKIRLAAGSGDDAGTAAPAGLRILKVASSTLVLLEMNLP